MLKSLPHLILIFILLNTTLDEVQSELVITKYLWSNVNEQSKPVSGLRCHQCFSQAECDTSNTLVECNYQTVQETALHFRFLPNAMNQAPVDDYYCATYTGYINNQTALLLSGCFYGSYNPCAFVTGTETQTKEYRCKYCNHHDGCNSASTIGVSVTAFLLYLFTTIV